MTESAGEMERKQITLRIPDEVYEALREIGKEAGITIHSLVLMALCEHIGFFGDTPQSQ